MSSADRSEGDSRSILAHAAAPCQSRAKFRQISSNFVKSRQISVEICPGPRVKPRQPRQCVKSDRPLRPPSRVSSNPVPRRRDTDQPPLCQNALVAASSVQLATLLHVTCHTPSAHIALAPPPSVAFTPALTLVPLFPAVGTHSPSHALAPSLHAHRRLCESIPAPR